VAKIITTSPLTKNKVPVSTNIQAKVSFGFIVPL
jgi:hypothetical protein